MGSVTHLSPPAAAFNYQAPVAATPAPTYVQPVQPVKPIPGPMHVAAPSGCTGIILPGQSGLCGEDFNGSSSGSGKGSGSGYGSGASSGGANGLDSMTVGAADAAAKVQQMAAGMAFDYISGNQSAIDSTIANGASQIGQTAASITGSRLDDLRYYFDVNNAYVLKKLQILLLPYRHAEWERKTTTSDQGEMTPRPPSQDPNAPDLYMPLMALTTYILVAGFISGADGRFTPEVLASTASTGLAIVILEVVLMKLAIYLLQSEGLSIPVLDLASCSGYKFVAVVLVLLTKTIAGTIAGYIAMAVAGASIGTFMAKTIRQCLMQGSGFTPGFVTDGMGSPGRSERRKKQLYSLLSVALLQPLFFLYLSCV